LTIILITHEMHVIRKICHQVAVMEAGKVVEQGPVREVFRKPKEAMTKEFVKQITEPEETADAISHMLAESPEGKVVQLTFVGEETERPLISQLIRQFDIDVNIVQGKITKIQAGSYGTLFIALDGKPEQIEAAIAFIRSKQVEVEVISHVE